jgi:hypothetical protein
MHNPYLQKVENRLKGTEQYYNGENLNLIYTEDLILKEKSLTGEKYELGRKAQSREVQMLEVLVRINKQLNNKLSLDLYSDSSISITGNA